jgi:hypothetical protein
MRDAIPLRTDEADQAPSPSYQRPDVTAALTRGTARLMRDMGLSVIAEFKLPNGRRADVCGLCPKGDLGIVEAKSCREDLAVADKW